MQFSLWRFLLLTGCCSALFAYVVAMPKGLGTAVAIPFVLYVIPSAVLANVFGAKRLLEVFILGALVAAVTFFVVCPLLARNLQLVSSCSEGDDLHEFAIKFYFGLGLRPPNQVSFGPFWQIAAVGIIGGLSGVLGFGSLDQGKKWFAGLKVRAESKRG